MPLEVSRLDDGEVVCTGVLRGDWKGGISRRAEDCRIRYSSVNFFNDGSPEVPKLSYCFPLEASTIFFR